MPSGRPAAGRGPHAPVHLPQLPPALADLLTRLLAKDARGRPTSAAEVADALRAIEVDLARPPSPPVAQLAPTSAAALPARRLRTLLAALALLLLAALLVGLGRQKPAPRDDKAAEETVRKENTGAEEARRPVPPKPPPALPFLRGHTDWVNGVAFSPDGLRLASVSRDRPMPDGLTIDPAPFAGVVAVSRVAVYDPPTRTILVNPDPTLWDQTYLNFLFQNGDFSTAHPHGTVYHEYSHFRVHDRSPVAYMTLHDPTNVLFRHDLDTLYPQVSDYAGQSALEFIGEVYAGLRTGHQYGPAVLSAYDTWLGFANLSGGSL